MKPVTIKDIAASLGISKSTVSRALSGIQKNVSKEVYEKVHEAAESMGYRKNEIAVNLRHRKTKTIGIIIPEAVTSFYLQFTTEVQKILQSYGYRIILTLSDEDYMIERSNLDIMKSCYVDGILISSCNYKTNRDIYEDFIKHSHALVFFDRTVPGLNCSSVRSDDYRSAFFLVEHLVYKGYKNIVHLMGPDYIRNSRERLRAYGDVLNKHGIEYREELVINAGVNEKDGAEAMHSILNSGLECDAIFCFTELQALGAKKVLQEHNIRIPEDIAIVSMSGTKLSTIVYPEITAVEQPLEKMAEEAARLLLAKIENPMSQKEEIVLYANMVIRSSTEMKKNI